MSRSPAPVSSRRVTFALWIAAALLMGGIGGFLSGLWFGRSEMIVVREPASENATLAPRAGVGDAAAGEEGAEQAPVNVAEATSPARDFGANGTRNPAPAESAGRPELNSALSVSGPLAAVGLPVGPGYARRGEPLPQVPVLAVADSMSRELVSLPVRAVRMLSDSARNRIYASTAGNEVVVIDARARSVVKRIVIGLSPADMALGVRGEKLYVINRFTTSRAIGVVDLKTLNVLPPLQLPGNPMAMSSDGAGRLFVMCAGETHTLFRIDEADGKVHDQLSDQRFRGEGFLACSQDGRRVYHGTGGTDPALLTSIATPRRFGKMSIVQERKDASGSGRDLVRSVNEVVCYPVAAESGPSTVPLLLGANFDQSAGEVQTPGPAGVSLFDPSRRFVCLASGNRPATIEFYELESQRKALSLTLGTEARAMAFDRTGELLYVATPDNVTVFGITPDQPATTAATTAAGKTTTNQATAAAIQQTPTGPMRGTR
jgi:hypothetical protein